MIIVTRTRRERVLAGAVGGGVAFLLGYLVTWILAGSKVASATVSGPFGSAVPDWKALLWVFYDSQFVGTRTPTVTGPDGALIGGGDLLDTVSLLGVEYLYVVPIVLLVAAGVAVTATTDATTARDGLEAGITVTIGYLLLAVLGLFVAAEGGIAPSPLRTAVVAGIVYPVAFGALGGAITGYIKNRR
ncbi:MAG: hypothetical protein V5A25_09605 [Halovenus sp.]